MRHTILIAWFFVVSGANFPFAPAVIGPFKDKSECESMHQWLGEQYKYDKLSWCWWDGR